LEPVKDVTHLIVERVASKKYTLLNNIFITQMPILKPEIYMKEKRFANTGVGKDTPGVRAGPNVYEVGDGDVDDIIRIENQKTANQMKINNQLLCYRLCCAGIIGGALAIGGAK
jgi:hypothetical protein